MKKFIILTAVAIFVLLTLVGCGCQDKIEYCDGNHVEEIIPAVEATCTSTGLTEGKKCAICDDIILMQEVTPKLSHVYTDSFKCQVCNKTAQESQGLTFALDTKTNTYALTSIGTCDDEDLVIPIEYNGLPVTKINSYSLFNYSMKTLTLSHKITEIEDYSISSCTYLNNITVSTENTVYKGVDGDLYTKDGKTLVQYAIGKENDEFKTPKGVETIGSCAFSSCSELKKIVLSDTVKTIGISAFVNCHYLEEISLNNVEKIDDNAFYGCSTLEELTIPESVSEMGYGVFIGCEDLKIQCKAKSQPEGWNENWNNGDPPIPVAWGTK